MELKNDLTFFIEDDGIYFNGEAVETPYNAYLHTMYGLNSTSYYVYAPLYNLYDSADNMFDMYIIKLVTDLSPSNADPIFCILVAEYNGCELRLGVL